MGLFERISKTKLIGTGSYSERLSVFWAFAWRAIVCCIAFATISNVAESVLLGPMKFPDMWQQGHYVRWTAMMLVGACIIYVSPIFAARWLLRSKYDRRTTWLDAARLWWTFFWRFWLLVIVFAAVLTLLFKLIPQLASIPALRALQMYFLPAAALPLAVWLVGGPMRHLILDDILPRYPQIGLIMFCTDCGLQMSDGAAFCSGCGKPTGVPTAAPIIPGRGLTSGRPAGKLFLSLLGAALVLGIAVNVPTIGVYYRASKGNATAQTDLGFLYSQGHSLPQSYQEAARWFRLAAEQGYARGQYNLAVSYADGLGVPQNYSKAVHLYRLAADQGHANSQYNLGLLYDDGRGVPQNYPEAVRLYRLAADQGHGRAQNNLAMMYDEGRGVAQDYGQAVRLYRLAANQGLVDAQDHLGFLYSQGHGVPQSYQEAARWFRLAADRGFASAQYNLGVSYDEGLGILRDDQQAVRLYRLAADQGLAGAQNHLALRYATGQGVPQDNIEAYKWCSLAAASGNSKAQEFRDILTARMTPSQVEKAQEMVRASVRSVYKPVAPSR
jgi:uncharacterized protein